MKKIEKRKFYLGDILNVVTDLLVAREKTVGERLNNIDILDFMTGEKLLTLERLRARKQCLPYLFKQHPWLNSPEMRGSIIKLENDLKPTFAERDEDKQREKQRRILDNWCSQQIKKYGETFEIEAIPYDKQNHPKDPLKEVIGEAKKMMGKVEIVIVEY